MSVPYQCRECEKTEAEVDMCRIREYQFQVFGKQCPRELELKPPQEKPTPTPEPTVAVESGSQVLQLQQDLKKRPWKQLVEEGRQATEQRDNAQWKLGDLANEFTTHYGKQDLQKYADEIGVNYNSLRIYEQVSRKFEFDTRVSFLLPWSYFRTVLGLDLSTAMMLLEKAKKEGWTRSQLEAAVKQLRPEEEKPWACGLCSEEFTEETKTTITLCPTCFAEFEVWRHERMEKPT